MNYSKKKSSATKILSTVERENFIGRNSELDALLRHASGENRQPGLLLLSAPALGVSELLKQVYDRLFQNQTNIIPIYFALKKSDKTTKSAALRFVQTFLRQTVAFRRQDVKILDAAPDICELAELAAPSDGYWIDRLVETCQTDSKFNDDRAFITNCLSAPLRAFAGGAKSLVMIDNLAAAEYFFGDIDFTETIREIFSRVNLPFIFAGKRRFVFNAMQTTNAGTLELEPLSFTDAGFLTENLAEKNGVKISDQTRDLIAAQTSGNPTFIKFLVDAAHKREFNLNGFQKVQKIYAAELFGGKIGNFYDGVFDEIAPNLETQKSILGLLYDALTLDGEKTPVDSWQRRTGLSEINFYRTMRLLNIHEIVRTSSNLVEPMSDNQILTDYVKSRFRLEMVVEPRALVTAEMLSEFIKRAPKTMAEFYRRKSAIGLRELLSVFDCQETPVSLFDYSIFKDEWKGSVRTTKF